MVDENPYNAVVSPDAIEKLMAVALGKEAGAECNSDGLRKSFKTAGTVERGTAGGRTAKATLDPLLKIHYCSCTAHPASFIPAGTASSCLHNNRRRTLATATDPETALKSGFDILNLQEKRQLVKIEENNESKKGQVEDQSNNNNRFNEKTNMTGNTDDNINIKKNISSDDNDNNGNKNNCNVDKSIIKRKLDVQ